jgi:hypothetical protein
MLAGSGTELSSASKLATPAVRPFRVATRVREYGFTVLPPPVATAEYGLDGNVKDPIWWLVSNMVLLFPPYAANEEAPPRLLVPPTLN